MTSDVLDFNTNYENTMSKSTIIFLCGKCCKEHKIQEIKTLGWFKNNCESCGVEVDIRDHGGAGYVDRKSYEGSDDSRATIEREARPYDYGGAVDDIAPLDEDRPF